MDYDLQTPRTTVKYPKNSLFAGKTCGQPFMQAQVSLATLLEYGLAGRRRHLAIVAVHTLDETGRPHAPHVVRWNGLYHMVFGDWEHMCLATSEDGKEFTRRILPDGATGVFTEGPGQNTRDPVLLFTKGKWHMHYIAQHSHNQN